MPNKLNFPKVILTVVVSLNPSIIDFARLNVALRLKVVKKVFSKTFYLL